jgi:hypothetical protein
MIAPGSLAHLGCWLGPCSAAVGNGLFKKLFKNKSTGTCDRNFVRGWAAAATLQHLMVGQQITHEERGHDRYGRSMGLETA